MRLIILVLGLYCLERTDFAAANYWQAKVFPVIDFVFINYLLIDLSVFMFILLHGDSLRTRRYAEDDLWFVLYNLAAPVIDSQYRWDELWYWLGIALEIVLLLLAFIYAGGLLLDALLRSGI